MRYDLRTLMFLTAFLLLCTGISTCIHYATSPIAFSPSTWQTYRWQRPRMVRDLLARQPLAGKTQADVEALLGTPDSSRDDDRLIYWAGIDGIDDEWLEVSFVDGKVDAMRCYPD